MSKTAFENRIYELKHLGIQITPEYKFCKTRKFRADFMLEYNGKQILIEYEGLYCKKSRHTTTTGYSTDTQKYNLACVLGFQVLRYTARTYKNVTDDVCKLFSIEL
jgi:hypothetical protein